MLHIVFTYRCTQIVFDSQHPFSLRSFRKVILFCKVKDWEFRKVPAVHLHMLIMFSFHVTSKRVSLSRTFGWTLLIGIPVKVPETGANYTYLSLAKHFLNGARYYTESSILPCLRILYLFLIFHSSWKCFCSTYFVETFLPVMFTIPE